MRVVVPEVWTLTVLKTLANDIHYETVRLLGAGERCVYALEALLNLLQDKVSCDLTGMRDAGLVVGKLRGKNS
ncbi:hypothetical protein [Deinococcus humi]|uniref:DNA-binding transcriptional ArsR family regulator n=1 Tax=Deinococcus humi TaxID=662880 RepID=A0A7W8NG09_9DEIO|nr:hypothetical protein [Deinococcus humi]MBB5362477.1 DNA-binding transcriptional ArsR family regulator [Deinococcus humi]GGO28652.1 hypothetical protein GCM10008949_21390 [Deinococcus humi]